MKRSLAAKLAVYSIAVVFTVCYTLIYPLVLAWVALTSTKPKETTYREDVRDLWEITTAVE